MERYDLYTQAELDRILTKDGILNYDVTIHGENISLQAVKYVTGFLGIYHNRNVDLGGITHIGGDFWINTYGFYVQSVNLRNLQSVGGNVNLSNTPISDLGKLESVGYSMELKNTPLKEFNYEIKVGGNLFLPKTLKYEIDKTRLQVGGLVQFFTVKLPQDNYNLTPANRPVPPLKRDSWNPQELNIEQKSFLQYLYENYEQGVIIDVNGYTDYIQYLFDYIAESYFVANNPPTKLSFTDKIKKLFFYEKPDITEWVNKVKKLRESYPYVCCHLEETFRKNGYYEEAWQLLLQSDFIYVYNVGYYEEKLKRTLFDADILMRLDIKSTLSEFGRQHMNDLVPLVEEQIKAFEKKWHSHFLHIFVNPYNYMIKRYEFYRQFYISDDFFDSVNSNAYQKHLTSTYDDLFFPHVVHNAIKEQCRKFLLEAEDQYRESIGMPKIGEFWISETRLYYSIKAKFEPLEVKQHASPKWLGRQHLDVYIPKYNIGLEYQGAQHYHPVEFFGGEEAFEKTKERDRIKKEKCEANNCHLIYVDEGYNLDELVNSIKEIIKTIERNR